MALTADTRFLTCPTRASIWCCWYLSCLASSSSWWWYCGSCHLSFGWDCFSLSHLILILCLSAFFKEMHIVYARISKAVLDTVPDTLLTSMEQAILEESLFSGGVSFSGIYHGSGTRVPQPMLQRKGLTPLPLIYMVKVPH